MEDDAYKDYLLSELFTTANVDHVADVACLEPRLTIQFLYDYAHDLKRTVQAYYEIANPSDSAYKGEHRVWLTRIYRLDWPIARPLLVAAMDVAGRGASDEDLTAFLTVLDPTLTRSTPSEAPGLNNFVGLAGAGGEKA